MYKSLALSLVCILGTYWSGLAQSTTFLFTGAVRTYTVPAGVTEISFIVKGANGGAAGPLAGVTTTPGCGGEVSGIMTVTPGQVLTIHVGGTGATGSAAGAAGGYPNGGSSAAYLSGTTPVASGGGGGGRSDIFIGTTPMVIAGAGGGAGYDPNCPSVDQPGGKGGGPVGANGVTCDATLTGISPTITVVDAGGGSTIGGNGGSVTGFGWTPGTPGGYLFGGNTVTGGYVGGGGGDGYYGGGGGSSMGGGGGSSYADASVTVLTDSQGTNCGGGIVILCALPNPGTITGPTSVCSGASVTLTNPTATGIGTWSSSSISVASIGSATGVLTGGATSIPLTPSITYTSTIACGSRSTTILFTVNPSPAAITGPVPSSFCAFSGSSYYAPGAIPNEFLTLGDATSGGTWGTSSPLITVSLGSLSSFTAGTYTISYTIGTCSATKSVTVLGVPGPVVSPITPPAVCESDSITVTDPLGPAGGTWSSASPSIEIVSPTGVVTGDSVRPGSAYIVYTAPDGCTQYLNIANTVAPLVLSPFGGIDQLCQGYAVGIYEHNGAGVYSISPAVGTFTYPTGAAYGAGGAEFLASTTTYGPAVITYTIHGCPGVTLDITVNPDPAPITVPLTGIIALCSGASLTLTDITPGGTWISANSSIATIGETTGVVSPGPSGIGLSTTIYYQLVTTGCFTDAPANVSLGSASITGPDSVCKGASITLAEVSTGGTWSSTDLAIAQAIDTSGVVNGISAGTVNISYTLTSGCYATKVFTVSPLIPAYVFASQSPADSVCAGTPITLTATSLNSGISPVFAWSKFEGLLHGVGDTTVYIDDSAQHGDVIIVQMTVHGICAVHDTVYDTIALNVYPTVLPVITIATSYATTVPYLGYLVTMFADVDHGGPSPTYQWYLNRLPIPGATANSYATSIFANDTFYCIVSGNPICSLDSTSIVTDTSNRIPFNINEVNAGVRSSSAKSYTFSLFPNPNNGTFTLSGNVDPAVNKDVEIEVSDILGNVVYRGKATPQNGAVQAQLKIDNLSEGTYLLRLNTGSENEVFHFVVGK